VKATNKTNNKILSTGINIIYWPAKLPWRALYITAVSS